MRPNPGATQSDKRPPSQNVAVHLDVWSTFGPPDQGNVLRGFKRGVGVDVVLDFAGASARNWRVYRDTRKTSIGVTGLTPDTRLATFRDFGAVPTSSGGRLYYDVKGLSDCTQTPGP